MLKDVKDQLLAIKGELEATNEGVEEAISKEMLPDLAGEFGRKMWELITERERASITGGLGRTGQWAIPDFEADYRKSFINSFAVAMEIVNSTLSGSLSSSAAEALKVDAIKKRLSFAPEAWQELSVAQGIEGLIALGMETTLAVSAIGLVTLGAELLYKAFDSLINVTWAIKSGFDRAVEKTVARLQRPLEIVGEILANTMIPIVKLLTPLLDGFARVIAWLYNELYIPVANRLGAELEEIDIEGKLNYEADDTMTAKRYSAGVTGEVTNNVAVKIKVNGLVDPEGVRKLHALLGSYKEDVELAR